MATVADDFKRQVLNTQFSQMIFGDILDKPPAITTPSSGTFVRSRSPSPGMPSAYSMEPANLQGGEPLSISSYTLTTEHSQFSDEVEIWMRGHQYTPTPSSAKQSSPMQSTPMQSSPGQVSSLASGHNQYRNEVDMWVRGNRGFPTSEINGKQGSSDYKYFSTEDRTTEKWERGNRGFHIEGHSILESSDYKSFSNEPELRERGNQAFPTESAGVQRSRVAVVQRSTLAPTTSLDTNGMWYIMAMILPLFSVNNCLQWRCTPRFDDHYLQKLGFFVFLMDHFGSTVTYYSTVFSAAEIFLAQLSTFVGEARDHIRRIARDQLARDLFATAMDIVLVVYAIGFLVLSLYQASVFG